MWHLQWPCLCKQMTFAERKKSLPMEILTDRSMTLVKSYIYIDSEFLNISYNCSIYIYLHICFPGEVEYVSLVRWSMFPWWGGVCFPGEVEYVSPGVEKTDLRLKCFKSLPGSSPGSSQGICFTAGPGAGVGLRMLSNHVKIWMFPKIVVPPNHPF